MRSRFSSSKMEEVKTKYRKANTHGSFSAEPFEKWPVMSFGISISIHACEPTLFNFGPKKTCPFQICLLNLWNISVNKNGYSKSSLKHISAACSVGFLRIVHGIFTQDLHRFNFNMNLYKILRNLRFSIGGVMRNWERPLDRHECFQFVSSASSKG